jgi:hypothetical protein
MLLEERCDLDRISFNPAARRWFLLAWTEDVEGRWNSNLLVIEQGLQMRSRPLVVALQDLHQ